MPDNPVKIYSTTNWSEAAFYRYDGIPCNDLRPTGTKLAYCYEINEKLIAARRKFQDPRTRVDLQAYLDAQKTTKQQLYVKKLNFDQEV